MTMENPDHNTNQVPEDIWVYLTIAEVIERSVR